MNTKLKQKWIALGAAIIVITGVAFAFSNRDLLKGSFPTTGPVIDISDSIGSLNLDLADTVMVYDDYLNEYYVDLAQTYANQAQEFADEADDCAGRLDDYYGWDVSACSDTDSGEDYEEQGSVTGTSWYDGSAWTDVEDFCLSDEELVEYFCLDDEDSVFDGMAYGEVVSCDSGYTCSEGACVPEEPNNEPNECEDDNDCDFGYYCTSSNTCNEVLTLSCKDSDDGVDYYEESTVSGTDFEDYDEVRNQTEYCVDSNTVMEYWCPESGMYEDYLYHSEFDCPDNYACQDGECVNILTDREYECEEPFTDTSDEMVCRAYNAGIVNGKSRTKFDPYAGITRAEVIKVIILTMGEDPLYYDRGIVDMDEDHWAWAYVNRAKDLGIITESTFNPDVEVTRGTTMVWLVRAAGETLDRDEWEDRIPWSDMDEDNPTTYAAVIANDTIVDFLDEGETPVAEGYTDGTFRPENNILRYEALYLAYRSYLAWFEDTDSFVDPNED